MAGEWIDRTIRGPAAEYLTADEFGRLFGLSGDTVGRMTKAGFIPDPIRLSKQTWLYTWEQVVYFGLKLKFAPPDEVFWNAVKGNSGKGTAATGGVTAATGAKPPQVATDPGNPRNRG